MTPVGKFIRWTLKVCRSMTTRSINWISRTTGTITRSQYQRMRSLQPTPPQERFCVSLTSQTWMKTTWSVKLKTQSTKCKLRNSPWSTLHFWSWIYKKKLRSRSIWKRRRRRRGTAICTTRSTRSKHYNQKKRCLVTTSVGLSPNNSRRTISKTRHASSFSINLLWVQNWGWNPMAGRSPKTWATLVQ